MIDLDLLPFDFGQWSRGQPFSELDPLLVYCCIMSYDVLHRIALTITHATTVHVPYHMTYAEGVNFSNVFEILTPIYLLSVQLSWRYDDI